MTAPSQNEVEESPALYRIRVKGRLDGTWSDWFDHLALSINYDGGASITTLFGPVRDQSALHGLLARIRDLGLTLLLVERVGITT
jgi:hypothetical protein